MVYDMLCIKSSNMELDRRWSSIDTKMRKNEWGLTYHLSVTLAGAVDSLPDFNIRILNLHVTADYSDSRLTLNILQHGED